MRGALTFFLGALAVMAAGVVLGFLKLDLSAPEDSQLAASGALAYYECYDEYGYDCVWFEDPYWEPYPSHPYPDEYLYLDECLYPEDCSPYLTEEELFLMEEDLLMHGDCWWDPVYGTVCPDEYPSDYWYGEYEYLYPDAYPEDVFLEEEYWYGSYYPEEVLYGYASGGPHYEEYYEEIYYEPVVAEPWYVESFPGIGNMVQQIVPGLRQQTEARYVQPQIIVQSSPAPAPAPRYSYPQASCWISAWPSSLKRGESSVVEWEAYNASTASLSGFGQVPVRDTRTIPWSSVGEGRTLTLSVSGVGGSGSCYTRISAEQAPSTSASCLISVYPSQISISRNESASLAWGASAGVSSAFLGGIGPTELSVEPGGGMYVSPSESTKYTLTVYDSSGGKDLCSTQLNVVP